MSTLSVVVPAHNEAESVGRCLTTLLGGARPGELEVAVVCNGCTDDTAARARSAAPDATVLELDRASKVDALNLGDEVVEAFPRLYLDADVRLDTAGVRALAAGLGGGVLATAPSLVVDASSSTPLVRSYVRIWSALPSIRDGLAGRGAILVSREGRARFDRFPDLIADDYFLDRLFAPAERRVLPEVTSTIDAAPDVATLVARRARVHAGNLQVDQRAGTLPVHPSARRPTDWLGVVVTQPQRIVDVPAYVGITIAARWRGRRRLARDDVAWDRPPADRGSDRGT